MAHQYLRALAGRVGQACLLDREQQIVLAQRTLADTGPEVVRCVPPKWICENIRGYHKKCTGFASGSRTLLNACLDIFLPLFEVTRNPQSHPELHVFLQRVIGFDSVDDESKAERRFHRKFPYPRLWDVKESPPYSYWYILWSDSLQSNTHRSRTGCTTCLPIWLV